ncbi:MAG: hypothetical protein GY790_06110 [Bacteroidetes bacterium]|nr:hypothetical protein [Bacteroidota bacterium]
MVKEVIKDIARPILTPLRPGNICMVHIGRCGSTVLSSLLRQHKNIFWASEFYVQYFLEWEAQNGGREVKGTMPGDAIDLVKESMREAFHKWYGIEIKPFHLRLINYSAEQYFNQLEELGFDHFVILDRHNRLRKMVSSIVAHSKKDQYHVEGKSKADLNKVIIDIEKVEIDYESKPLLEYLQDYDRQFDQVNELLQGRKLLNLNFEEHIQEDPRVAYHQMCEFLGLKPKNVSVKLSRTNPFPLAEMIENIDEVKSVLEGTSYEWMLNE